MSTETNYLNLIKHASGDMDWSGDMNSNFDIIDAAIQDLEDKTIKTEESGEFSTLTEKTAPVSTDQIIIEDSEDGNSKKMVQVGNLSNGMDIGEENTASNLGTSSDGSGLFDSKSGVDLQFKRIKAGDNVTLTEEDNDILISASGGSTGDGEANTASNLGTSSDGAGLFDSKSGVDLQFKRIKAGDNVTLTEEDNDVVISVSGGGSSGAAEAWTDILSFITPGPASTSTIETTSDLTGIIKVGYPLKYTIGGSTYYGIITEISSGLITIAGVALSGTITAIYYADGTRTRQHTIPIPGYYADNTVTNLIQTDRRFVFKNRESKQYVVQVIVSNFVSDSGSESAQINVTVGGSDLLSSSLSVGTLEASSGVMISTSNYEWLNSEVIEIDVIPGTNGDSEDLFLDIVTVIP